jgi:hypothetical protein
MIELKIPKMLKRLRGAGDISPDAVDEISSPDRLLVLAWHPFKEVRERVAINPATPKRALWRLLHDPFPSVRDALLDNPNLTVKMLKVLCNDKDQLVRYNATLLKEYWAKLSKTKPQIKKKNKRGRCV